MLSQDAIEDRPGIYGPGSEEAENPSYSAIERMASHSPEGEQDTAGVEVWSSGTESVTSAFAAPALVIGPIEPVRVRIRDVVADADHGNPLRIHVRAIEVR